MMTNAPDFQHLAALIEAAKAEADRIGGPAGPLGRSLGEAADAARALVASDGRPAEGLRPEDLTTENDE